jgi:hypothetical protein
MADLVLVVKSYRGDAARVKRLLESLVPRNPQALPVVVAVPRNDLSLFREWIGGFPVDVVTDEDIVVSHPRAAALDLLARYRQAPGYRAQQVVKAEAWRLLGCDTVLCVDSDTVFLRELTREAILTPAGHPYTVLHQSRDLMQLAIDRGHPEVVQHFRTESETLKALFGRTGPDYDFGPTPVPWSSRVWADLDERLLQPGGWTLWDAIDHAPTELRWYGEALLAYRSIPIDPVEPLARVYHHEWQWLALRGLGETTQRVAEQFLAVVYQSNWDFESDMPGARSALSRAARRVKRWRRRWGGR